METILVLCDDPALAVQVKDSVGERARVAHARNFPAALSAFEGHQVGIVVSDIRVNNEEAVPLLLSLKQRHPAIVTVVCTEVANDRGLTALLHEGHVYRLIPKPVKTSVLRLTISAAASKRRELCSNPFLTIQKS
jgi:DNA-binding NtrC family response regulator